MMVVRIWVVVFWVFTPYSLVCCNHGVEETFCPRQQGNKTW